MSTSTRIIFIRTLPLALLVGLVTLLATAPAQAKGCTGATQPCYEAGLFTAKVTSVTPSWGRYHKSRYLRLSIDFTNTSDHPVSLAFPWRSAATATDSYGNIYSVDWRFRQNIVGIATVGHNSVDGRFTIAPHSSRSASWILGAGVGGNAIGKVYSVSLPIHELTPIPGQQGFKVGDEYVLNYQGLGEGVQGTPVASGGCVGTTQPCYDAGLFTATVTSVNASWGRYHKTRNLRLNVSFRNTSSQPVALAFPWRNSSAMVDQYGNRYTVDTRYKDRIAGIAVLGQDSIKGAFVLTPGASRNASWVFSVGVGNGPVGSAFSVNLPIDTVVQVPGRQRVRPDNQYALDFQSLGADTAGLFGNNNPGNQTVNRAGKIAKGLQSLLHAIKQH
ncbi:MAG: hypothetical protein ACREPY_00190 [Rhodanobacteraceae bacterium]